MAGHSKWKNIQVRKTAQDSKKSKFFTRVTKELMLAAKAGGSDPGINARLRSAIAAAKAVNLPKDKIDLAVKKGSGEIAGESYDEVSYEGYGPSGVAVYIEAATDNRNRTVAEIRAILSKNGGNMGEAGCVAWMFEKKGVLRFPKSAGATEDGLMEIGLEAGVQDIFDDGDAFVVQTDPEDFSSAQAAFEAAGLILESAELTFEPANTISVDAETARKLFKLIEALEDNDDVQKVHANFDVPEDVLAALG
jgi:YebC/PmpR family DNA-binding regulatory protein